MIKDCHVGVKGIIMVNDRCLVLKKMTNTGTFWDIPGGRIDDDENLETTLERELKEELPSIKNYKIDSIISAYRLSKDIADDKGLVLIFFKVIAEDFKVELSDEHCDYRWISNNDISELLKTDTSIESGYYDALVKALVT